MLRRLAVVAAVLAFAVPALALDPTMSIFAEDPASPIIHGATNLPDDAELIVTLSRTQSAYMAQAEVTVHNGHFATQRFSQGGRPLNPGFYKLDVTMSAVMFQPQSVQAVIGPDGDKLSGRLVKDTPLGPMFEYVSQVNISGIPNAQMDAAAKERAKAEFRQWLVDGCTTNLDFVNSLVASGAVSGHLVVGAERQKRIEDCTREAMSRPLP